MNRFTLLKYFLFNIPFQNVSQNNFCHVPKIWYLDWERRSRFHFCFQQRCITNIQAITKRERKFTRFNRRHENQNMGPSGPRHRFMQLSVKINFSTTWYYPIFNKLCLMWFACLMTCKFSDIMEFIIVNLDSVAISKTNIKMCVCLMVCVMVCWIN